MGSRIHTALVASAGVRNGPQAALEGDSSGVRGSRTAITITEPSTPYPAMNHATS
ncbi:hypothetical protein HETIRDRAFT_103578 [Heterobasidion irregulare TC 32-1]|uniref:Uncharacterized protein n=1 Tax=Heterobasidion irregulare (strain TC 32-1) TaxID=747525 RepID=W4K290_HETIT|nr:uncharacterized protein HETIRDRAFT_103578 [Heterobasidion irregulare TC 32-1]ETW79834.1 hypothetical protein HETIRDRAFT_103578 [Heterobasidion irregulare TC 32-1]